VIDDPTQGGWQVYRTQTEGKVKPFTDGDPAKSYEACGVNQFPIVYNDRIYKCPPSSMIRTHLEKNAQLDDPDWAPYSNYRGLHSSCTDEQLAEFVNNIHQAHPVCGMCPACPETVPQPDAHIKHRQLQ
jgi:hypothetical protein